MDIHADDPAFGYRFIADELPEKGITAGENRVQRLCRDHGIWSVFSKKRGLNRRPGPPVHDDLVQRDFTAVAPHELWLTDITEHPTAEGRLYLCAVKDAYSGRIVGYSMDSRMKSSLAVAALENAVRARNPAGTVVHSDRGSQGVFNRSKQHLVGRCWMSVRNSQKQVRAYRGQILSPGRPSVAWREDRVRFWVAIASGAKTRDAGVAAGVSEPVAHRWFLHAGGVNPQLAPTLSGRYLSSSEREDIALWRAQDCGVREIARRLGRSPSTISRELRRNASTRTYRLDYKASTAQWHAERRARRPKTAKLITNDDLRDYVSSAVTSEPAEENVWGRSARSGMGRTSRIERTGNG